MTSTPSVPRTLFSYPKTRAEAMTANDKANAGMITRPVRVRIGSRAMRSVEAFDVCEGQRGMSRIDIEDAALPGSGQLPRLPKMDGNIRYWHPGRP